MIRLPFSWACRTGKARADHRFSLKAKRRRLTRAAAEGRPIDSCPSQTGPRAAGSLGAWESGGGKQSGRADASRPRGRACRRPTRRRPIR